jgi:pyruvate carboxylase subunit B
LEQAKEENRLIALARKGKLVEKVEKPTPEKGPGVRTFNVFVDGDYFEVEVDEVGGAPVITSVSPMVPQPVAAPAPAAVAPAAQPTPAPAPAEPTPKPAAAAGTAIEAPMPGMVIRYEVKEGDSVNQGDVVLILEAMKMENSIAAPTSGTVLSIPFKNGDSVQKGDTLAVIG